MEKIKMESHKMMWIVAISVYLFGGIDCKNKIKGPIIKTVWSGGLHSEGPHWSVKENALYWVDIKDQYVHRLDTTANNVTSRYICYGPVTPVIPVANSTGKLVVGVRAELFILSNDAPQSAGASALRVVTFVDLGLPDNRMNDGKVDAKGRLWIGTMGKEEKGQVDTDQGSLFLITKDNYHQPEVKVKPVSVSNGIAWTKDNKYMFYIDTPTRNVDVFDFDLEKGEIRNRRTIFSFAANKVSGLPDGMTIDTDDNLWVACFNGGKVIKVDSRSGRLLQQHMLPVNKVTSVSWGGPDLSTLYVTTSRLDLTAEELAQQPEAGSVFAIEGTGSRGLPANEFVFP